MYEPWCSLILLNVSYMGLIRSELHIEILSRYGKWFLFNNNPLHDTLTMLEGFSHSFVEILLVVQTSTAAISRNGFLLELLGTDEGWRSWVRLVLKDLKATHLDYSHDSYWVVHRRIVLTEERTFSQLPPSRGINFIPYLPHRCKKYAAYFVWPFGSVSIDTIGTLNTDPIIFPADGTVFSAGSDVKCFQCFDWSF